MKLNFIYTLFIAALGAFIFLGNADGRATQANQGNTGAPGDEVSGGVARTCQTCHSSGSIGVTLDLSVFDESGTAVTEYLPGQTYDVSVSINHVSGPTPAGYGFQMVSLFDADNSDVAAWSDPSSNTQIATASANGRSYAEHNGTSSTNVFTVKWTAPEAGNGSVTFYSCGNGVNGGGTNGGDGAAINTLQLAEGTSTSTRNLASEMDIKVFPNPVKESLNIQLNNSEKGQYEINIINLAGQVLASETRTILADESTQLLDLRSLTSGAYFLQIINEKGSVVQKIFKQ